MSACDLSYSYAKMYFKEFICSWDYLVAAKYESPCKSTAPVVTITSYIVHV